MKTKVICIPKPGEAIEKNDLFMVRNVKHPLYGEIFRCKDYGPENFVIPHTDGVVFHHLNVSKVEPYKCTSFVNKGDLAWSMFDAIHPRGIIQNMFFGLVTDIKSESELTIMLKSGMRVDVPAVYTFKTICKTYISETEYGNGGFTSLRIPKCWI
ncbi:hypothetical protein HGH93_23590 [Chitinophaga polysaccharea]|uniref:hypothetical protein n=1 Tax=Chitinophaga polysaccharea TaxID=1293035 RepID=UPI0014556275|nr:hypothetical protein [Chitinophaga polysaccharea]NLR61105.1 hypothetical protein [Chitinophaga polysaccharea]